MHMGHEMHGCYSHVCTKVEPFAMPSGTAIVIKVSPAWYHLCDGVFDGAVNGFIYSFNYVNWWSKKN